MLFILPYFTTKEFIVIAASIVLLILKRFRAPSFSYVDLCSFVKFVFLLEWHKRFVCVCFNYKMEESGVQALHSLLC
jgi:hypothetical protein